jgi:predicted patatin/cPLA2 family phospholipase
VSILVGCRGGLRDPYRRTETPVTAGYNTNNLLDPATQAQADALGNAGDVFNAAEHIKRKPTAEQLARRQSILCISGGGSYGAYSAGVLCGWTAHGDRPGVNGRPNFSVVTGISTGALIAPYAFLGPRYDEQIRRFYTTVDQRDIYRLRPVRGLFSVALADNTPLADLIEDSLTPELVAEVGEEHRKGRRLYIGTTELESGRFVSWDIGEIAARNGPGDRELIKQILLGSSAIPGFFPPSKIPVTVNGKTYVEQHGDGGASMSIFVRPPFVPPEQRSGDSTNLAGVDLYLLVAGKLYADAEALRQRSLMIGTRSVSSVLYAQTRGDLQRLYLISTVSGMNYHLSAIPPEFPAPTSSTDFDRRAMTAMFKEGYALAAAGAGWRDSPPGAGPGESPLQRSSTNLIEIPRGPGRVVP